MEPLAIVLLSLIFFLIFLYKQKHANKNNLLPPSPPKLPILGNLHQMSSTIPPYRSLQSLSAKYGDLMMLYFGRVPVLVASSARAAGEILKTHDTVFLDRPVILSAAIKQILFNCKDLGAAPYGEEWRLKKILLVQLLLSNQKVRSFRHVKEEETVILLENITKLANSSSTVNLSEAFMSFVTKVICTVAFGRKYCEKAEAIDSNGISEVLGTATLGDFNPWLSWVNHINGWTAKVDKLYKEIDQFFEEVITEHENNDSDCTNGTVESGDEKPPKSFVDAVLDVQKRNKAGFPIDRESIKGLSMDVLLESGPATALLEWAMTELIRHPQVMEKLQDEVRGVAGGKPFVDDDDLDQMKYLKAVIKETLRLHPPSALAITRQSLTSAKIENRYEIPAGTMVIINTWAVQRDPSVWDEPEKYNPNRFLTSKSCVDFRGQDMELIPFGSGKRMCPGISFIMGIIELLLANLMHKFDWSLPVGQKIQILDIEERRGLFARTKIPVILVAKLKHTTLHT